MNIPAAIGRIYGEKPVSFKAEPIAADSGLTSRISTDAAGVRQYTAVFADGRTVSFAGKRKSARIILNGIRMVSGNDLQLAGMLLFHHKVFGYSGSSVREAILYSTPGLLPKTCVPHIEGAVYSRLTGRCFIAMEILPQSESAVHSCEKLLCLLAKLHAKYFGKADRIRCINRYSPADYRKSRTVLRRAFDRLSDENTEIFGKELTAVIHRFLARIDLEYSAVAYRRTLTHNDCCARNICVHGDRICIYDWELACCQNPEHDVIELLISLMDQMTDAEVLSALCFYRRRISFLTGVTMSDAQYLALLRFNTLEFCVNKLSVLRLAGRQLHVGMPRLLAIQTARMMRLLGIHEKGTKHARRT